MTNFDPLAKEEALRAESETWDTSTPVEAAPGDVPVVDVSAYLESKSDESRKAVATELRHACETVGFWQLVGHGIAPGKIDSAFAAVRQFHALPLEDKQKVLMDRADWPLGGVGYLPVGNRKLPARSTGNANEAFIIKGDRDLAPDDNQWLPEDVVPGFRAEVEQFAALLEQLTLDLLPLYATALDLETGWFAAGFEHPFWRLRMTRYPAAAETSARSVENNTGAVRRSDYIGPTAHSETTFGERSSRSDHGSSVEISTGSVENNRAYGINPHVDTTFFTLLLQDSPGLTIYHTPTGRWLHVPMVEDAFVVNSGELLRQWTNDRFLSVRHFANSSAATDRYSIPFFVNATRDFPMECIPTCCSEENPAKYPTISYNESQGVVQGE